METIVVYTPNKSARLTYVLDWLLKERLRLDYKVVREKREIPTSSMVIAFGQQLTDSYSIPSWGLLTEQGIQVAAPPKGTWNGLPVFYTSADKNYTIPFDIFSAIFFLLSRYEEYYHYTPDKHGRYPAASSILQKNGWLQRPLIDEWVMEFKASLEQHFNIKIALPQFSFRPTYDIDMAYSHLHKGVGRIAGAYLRALMRADMKQINQRTQVLQKKQKDPYDSFRWMRQQHKAYGYVPLYFVLSAARTTQFDKNIHPQHPAMVRVIKNLVKEGSTGIHPSYYSDNGNTMQQEKATLEKIAGRVITQSRQHYIRAIMPYTYQQLLRNKITEDYSMGYGTHLGFRAGTGSSFLWYDIEHEKTTTLRIYPFCFMDTTAHYEMNLSTHEAFERLEAMTKLLEQTGSTLITIFHNFSLGTDEEWRGWRQAYELFLQDKATRGAGEIIL
ncbi:MAG: polysaccharide deacetylase family protein [Taibaiella sp.]|nr:polysaccharide deacetylase family protein [Taibaiella sp.]